MNTRRLNNSMTNSEYRIDLNNQNNIEEILHQVQTTTNNDTNNDHLHQLINFFKENLTSTFPFALIIILKAFYEYSAGTIFIKNTKRS